MNEHTNNEQITVIGAGTHIKGEMTFDRTARILGSFEGKISSNGEIQIGESAKCKAAIEGEVVRIDGTVEGDVVARECVHLSNTARMTGDVVASKMIVAEGANFLGHCRVGPEAVKDAEPRASRSVEKTQAQVETRPVDMARSKLADAQARLARMGTEAEAVPAGDEAAA
jgi:cytoskeletal protein CcmA (bactofilin family)